MKHSMRHIEVIKAYCLHCWARLEFHIEWAELEGKTMKDIQQMCNDRHVKVCVHSNVRLGNATTTR